MTTQSPKFFYATDSWDETDWLDIVSVEYESLVSAYPFDSVFREISNEGPLKVLDVGCGSAIFSQYLEPTLDNGLQLECDLLDVSDRSLHQASATLGELKHFSVGRSIQAFIEDIPAKLPASGPSYGAIWAIHSLTTVELQKMPAVLEHLLQLLSSDGRLFIYQLAADSSYQTFHRTYRQWASNPTPRFMEFEDTVRILDSLPSAYEVLELRFDHELAMDRPNLVEHYLRKCVLDESIDAEEVFGDILPRFKDSAIYRIPQHVNFISVARK